MQLAIEYTKQFKRDLKKAKKQGKDLDYLKIIMKKIIDEKDLPQKVRDHALTGNWKYFRELHLEPDWLLIYRVYKEENLVVFVRNGSHAELFG